MNVFFARLGGLTVRRVWALLIPATFLTWFIPFVFVGVNAAREGSAGPWALVIVLSGGVVGWFCRSNRGAVVERLDRRR